MAENAGESKASFRLIKQSFWCFLPCAALRRVSKFQLTRGDGRHLHFLPPPQNKQEDVVFTWKRGDLTGQSRKKPRESFQLQPLICFCVSRVYVWAADRSWTVNIHTRVEQTQVSMNQDDAFFYVQQAGGERTHRRERREVSRTPGGIYLVFPLRKWRLVPEASNLPRSLRKKNSHRVHSQTLQLYSAFKNIFKYGRHLGGSSEKILKFTQTKKIWFITTSYFLVYLSKSTNTTI